MRPVAGPASDTIRPATPADLDGLLRLEATFPGDKIDRRGFRRAVASATLVTLVAERGDSLVGYVFLETRRGARVGRLSSVAVSPDAAGKGLGRRLTAAAEAAALAAGCDRVRLEVRADNPRASRLYETSGYRRFAVVDDYYEDGEAAWRYEKRIGPQPSA